MPVPTQRKPDKKFFDQQIGFFLNHGKTLARVHNAFDDYGAHSVIKLIATSYWVSIFVPIIKEKLVHTHDYSMVYVDTMGGSGVTRTKRGDFFVGSCPAALMKSVRGGLPFTQIEAVERNHGRAAALEARLEATKIQIGANSTNVHVHDKPLEDVAEAIAKAHSRRTASYSFIDPEGFEGMTWAGLRPILSLKGDAMVTWFEDEALRFKEAALGNGDNAAACTLRMNDIFGEGAWEAAKAGTELATAFVNRVLAETAKKSATKFEVVDSERKRYTLLLFAGEKCPDQLPEKWRRQMKRRFKRGVNISAIVDVRQHRMKDLDFFGSTEEE